MFGHEPDGYLLYLVFNLLGVLMSVLTKVDGVTWFGFVRIRTVGECQGTAVLFERINPQLNRSIKVVPSSI